MPPKGLENFTLKNHVSLLELSHEKKWAPEFYRDDIHPTAEGNKIFAQLLHQRLEELHQSQ